jgi:hypothetical protein
MNLLDDFREIRRVSTPFVFVVSSDYRATIKALSAVRVKDEVPACVSWDMMRGHVAINEAGKMLTATFGDPEDTKQAPAAFLAKAIGGTAVPNNTMLFLIIPSPEIMMDPNVAQAIANVRDPFKSGRRTLVIIAPGLALPPIIKDDMPILTDPLPNDKAIVSIIRELHADMKKSEPATVPLKEDEVSRAVDLCRGLTRFAAEESIARTLRKTWFDLDGLADMQRITVEASTNKALTFERGKETFDSIGGYQQFKSYMSRLFAGPKPPRLIVRWDEIEKSVSSAAEGQVADNTGVSQDQLRVLLTCMEDYGWSGAILVGGPGVGKSLASVCTGNTFKIRTLNGDLGATKGSLVGESERAIRQTMAVIRAMGGDDVFFMATCNKLETLPAALQRRFTDGIWYFDLPDAKEREAIWRIQKARFGIMSPPSSCVADNRLETLACDGWTGSDIRNCCRTAYRCNISLTEASQYITLAGRTAAKDIAKLRELAERSGFLSANRPGAYRRTEADEARTITV